MTTLNVSFLICIVFVGQLVVTHIYGILLILVIPCQFCRLFANFYLPHADCYRFHFNIYGMLVNVQWLLGLLSYVVTPFHLWWTLCQLMDYFAKFNDIFLIFIHSLPIFNVYLPTYIDTFSDFFWLNRPIVIYYWTFVNCWRFTKLYYHTHNIMRPSPTVLYYMYTMFRLLFTLPNVINSFSDYYWISANI